MSRKEGDLCPHCNEGHLTVHPDREIRENELGSASHRTWECDKCGKQTRDFERGINQSVGISDSVNTKKN